MSETRTPLPHALCTQLCSKKLYMLDVEREIVLEDLQTAGYENYWCLHNGTDTGPDGGWVTYDRCAPARACYQPVERSVAPGYRIQSEHVAGGEWPELNMDGPVGQDGEDSEDLKPASFGELLKKRTEARREESRP